MSSFEKFNETSQKQSECRSSLSAKRVSDKKYQQVLKVWNKFSVKIDERLS